MDRDEQQPSLRERRRRQTEDEIGNAALELFERQGVAATTAEDIARAAGISPRTFFRFCATKEQAVMLGDRELETDLLAELGALRAGDDAYAALETYWHDALTRLGADPTSGDRFLRVRRLALHEPTVLATSLRLDAERTELRVSTLVASTGTTPLRARAVVDAFSTMVRLTLEEWVRSVEAGDPADPLTVYAQCRVAFREAVAGSRVTA
ncbi:TetR family transcriptional regulator [Pseudonocardia sulfidoxydans NBRC 16205]|uniref:TetR family transcriptional regulator n=1 Tax=Pseudonocardia sulfidoxydans NBRC 16205 TaxID=1223511 RepID=A0A511DJX3_9PSEU|nr:TetR/AcrR family transcriptional regulator [Pseudonocardia sulfidoxydans]GEL23338.1 TetR family transcriptional regulator [Pseudonocardia sulfidoxydans NBRC 16205]